MSKPDTSADELREKIKAEVREHGIDVSGFRVGKSAEEAADSIMQLLSDTVKAEVNKVLDELVNHKKVGTIEVFGGVFGTTKNIDAIPLSAIEQVRKEWGDAQEKTKENTL